MKKFFFLALIVLLSFTSTSTVFAEDMADANTASAALETQAAEATQDLPPASPEAAQAQADTLTGGTTETSETPIAESTQATVPAEEPAVSQAPAVEAVSTENVATENLEFISGEITALDEAAQNISVKLYGETEEGAADKIISIKIDQNTDLTDGEKDRDFKSLAVGTEVDVEYDPASNRATYIFVY